MWQARHDPWLDLTSPRLHPLPLCVAAKLPSNDPERLSISGAEERRHFAAVRDALGLDPTWEEEEGSVECVSRKKTMMSRLNSAGFRVPASKKVPMPTLLAGCHGLPPAGLRAAKLGLQRALETSLSTPSAEDADSPAALLPAAAGAAAGVVGRSSGAGVDFMVKSRAYCVASPSSGGSAPMMIGLGGGGGGGGVGGGGGDGSRHGWLSSATALTSSAVGLFGGSVGEGSCAAAEAQLKAYI
jgi:hypothetical protein